MRFSIAIAGLLAAASRHPASAQSEDAKQEVGLRARALRKSCQDVDPVCSSDGLTYQNACLARDQGEFDIQTLSFGACGEGARYQFDTAGAAITKDDMKKYAAQGFQLLGRVQVNQRRMREHNIPGEPDLTDLTSIKVASAGEENKVTQITPEGLVYEARSVIRLEQPDALTMAALSAQYKYPPMVKGVVDDQGRKFDDQGRKLGIIGADTRVKINHLEWPSWRLGELDYFGLEGGCSGSIVGVNKVLTAAHCVYDAVERSWMVPEYFAPGRYRSSSGETIEPWSTWPVAYATIYTAWKNTGSYEFDDVVYDVAILTMRTNWAGNIGSYMGILPVISTTWPIASDATLAGYPGDKPDGEMWGAGECEEWSYALGANILYFKCDAARGHSGSGVYGSVDGTTSVFATLSGGSSRWNAGYAFTSDTKDAILSWGGYIR